MHSGEEKKDITVAMTMRFRWWARPVIFVVVVLELLVENFGMVATVKESRE